MMTSYDSRNFEAQNNLAATSLLLKLNLSKAHQLAKEVYSKHPEQPIIASTYAYSLYLQGRTKEAMATFEKLTPEALENSAVALYYGVVLSASGETDKAAKYFKIAN